MLLAFVWRCLRLLVTWCWSPDFHLRSLPPSLTLTHSLTHSHSLNSLTHSLLSSLAHVLTLPSNAALSLLLPPHSARSHSQLPQLHLLSTTRFDPLRGCMTPCNAEPQDEGISPLTCSIREGVSTDQALLWVSGLGCPFFLLFFVSGGRVGTKTHIFSLPSFVLVRPFVDSYTTPLLSSCPPSSETSPRRPMTPSTRVMTPTTA